MERFVVFLRKHWDKVVLVLFICCYIGTLSTLAILRHNAFASNFDLSNMDHTMWNTLHGKFFSLRFHDDYVSRLSVHADFILILLSPLYLIWDDVRMLLFSQAFFLGIGAIPVYLLAKKVIKNKVIALSIAAVYLLNPNMQWTNIYDFHPVSLGVPFFLFAFYFAYLRKWQGYVVFAVLAILTKENLSLNIAMLGLVIFFLFKNRKVGAVSFLGGIAWFFLMVFIVMPRFSPDSIHWALQEFEGQGGVSSMQTAFDPIKIAQLLFFDPKTIAYYVHLMKPFGFLPVAGFPWLFLALPSVVINLLRDTAHTVFHYDTEIIPALVIATIFGYSYLSFLLHKFIRRALWSKVTLYGICLGMMLIALRNMYFYSPLPITPSCWCFIYQVTEEDRAFEKALQSIPPDASITASLEIRPHVNHRADVWFFPSATESARFIALMTQNRIIGNYEPKFHENEIIPVLLADKKHRVIFRSEHFYLFEKVPDEK